MNNVMPRRLSNECCPTALRRVNSVTLLPTPWRLLHSYLYSCAKYAYYPVLLGFHAIQDRSYIITSSYPLPPPIAALEYGFCGELCGEICPCGYQINPAHAEPKMLSPPSEVKATRLLAFAPQATSLADAALRTGSDQLFDALVYCCTVMLPEPAVARNWPV